MTIEELKDIPFHFVAHMAMEREHTMSYETEDGRLGFCDHTPKRKNGDIDISFGFEDGDKAYDVTFQVIETKPLES